jgi:T-complex protein 1 subunit delta
VRSPRFFGCPGFGGGAVHYTLAQNAGLNALLTVTELRNRHAGGDQCAGINVRRGTITDILEENVVQPLLVSTSAFTKILEIVRLRLPIRASVCFAKVVP